MTDQPVEEPRWRGDFPYESAGEEAVTRREFTRFLAYASVALAGSSGLVALAATLRPANVGPEVRIMALDEVPPGRSRLFRYPTEDDPAIIIRTSLDEVVAFSQRCTHLGCVVFWDIERFEFECPCHEGVFDVTGEPTAGPPQRPLARIDVVIRDREVWAVGVAEGTH
ncbi:MAG: Rieske (2Fe-2S) protein [Acidimicrobiia bacterium]|nr:Rieske (2Fe-2S) protein [Acidimicrobiia bacterium]